MAVAGSNSEVARGAVQYPPGISDIVGDKIAHYQIMPESVTGDETRMERFRREAPVLAQLSHPKISSIHGVEQSSGVHALVIPPRACSTIY